MKKFWKLVIFVMIFALATAGCFNKNATSPATWNPLTWGDEVATQATSAVLPIVNTPTATLPAPATIVVQDLSTALATVIPLNTPVPTTVPAIPVATTTALGDFILEPNTLGDEPQNGENVDQQIYKKPYEAGTITDDKGKGLWTQSGKNGSADLLGSIPSGSWLQVDSYIFWKGDQILTGGNLIVVAGPMDLDALNISYKDGGANLVTGDLQAFLDDNVWGKFCRGNIAPDGKSFIYKSWALKNIQLPAGFTFKSLADCPKNASEDTTTIPDLP